MGVEDDFQLPTGFRFHPTDEELVTNYLCRKCAGKHVAAPIIADIEIYRYDPWDLPEMALYGEKEWYFFSPRDRKYPNGSRPNRSAGSGYWKATGVDKPIGFPKPLGIKKALVFYAGKAPEGTKTNWIMHEYRLANVDRSARGNYTSIRLDEWVLCRIYEKKGGPPDRHTDPTSVRPPKQMRITRPPPPMQQQSPPLDYCLYFENSSPYTEYCRESEVMETWKGAEWDRKNEFSIENVVRPSPPPLMSQPPLLEDVLVYLRSPY